MMIEKHTPYPVDIEIQSVSHQLKICFSDHSEGTITFECLRVYSPSADVRGHSSQNLPLLVFNKQAISILKIEPVGHYAIRLHFSDNHHTGIYTWSYLYWLSQKHDELMTLYRKRVIEQQVNKSA